eukprot:g2903.t1
MLHLVRRGGGSLKAVSWRGLLRPRPRDAPAAGILQRAGGARRSVYRGSNRFRRERSNLKNPYREASRSDSREPFNPLDAYLRLLERHPLPTKALTSMLIVGVGDIGCQVVLGEEGAKFDWKRFVTFTFLGGALVGPTLHFWYGFLNKIVPGVGTAAALKRLAIDQTIFAASFIPVFMTSAMILEGNELSSIPPAIRREWFPALLANWSLWIPGNFVNFRFVTPRLQVLFANLVALGWNAYLSWASHRVEASSENAEADASRETMLWSDHSRVQGLFEEFDQDSNGYISRDEFQDLAFALGLTLSAQQCEKVIARIDKDGDGLVDLSEFKTWLHTPSTARTSGDATDEGQLEALLLKTKLRARVVMRELRTQASGMLPAAVVGKDTSKSSDGVSIHIGAPMNNNLVRRKTIRLKNNKALRAVPTEAIEAEIAKRRKSQASLG